MTQEWKSGFFQRTTLQSLGLRVQLGHPLGQPCPFRARAHQSFVVIHVNGVHLINLDFCACSDSPLPREQLLEVGWWPSTPLEPQSAASMTVLRSFHAWNLQGQISSTDFYRGLEQMTCGDGLSSVPVGVCLSVDWKHHSNTDAFQGSLGPVDVDGARVASYKNDKTGWAWSRSHRNRWYFSGWPRDSLSCLSTARHQPPNRLGKRFARKSVR